MTGACHITALAMMAALLAACASPPRVAAPQAAPPAPPVRAGASADPYDWHVLLVAPFGSLLKDIPLALHEVLLFRDEARGAAADDAECYTAATAPDFMGVTPHEYLLCFQHDRLSRIEASLHLPAARAAQTFAEGCAAWLKNAAARPAAQGAATCEGSDGDVHFSGRLAEEPDRSAASLSITLGIADRQ